MCAAAAGTRRCWAAGPSRGCQPRRRNRSAASCRAPPPARAHSASKGAVRCGARGKRVTSGGNAAGLNHTRGAKAAHCRFGGRCRGSVSTLEGLSTSCSTPLVASNVLGVGARIGRSILLRAPQLDATLPTCRLWLRGRPEPERYRPQRSVRDCCDERARTVDDGPGQWRLPLAAQRPQRH